MKAHNLKQLRPIQLAPQKHLHSIEIARNVADLRLCGLRSEDIAAIRRLAIQLHRWFELECGTNRGLIQQNEETGVWTYHAWTPRGYDIEGYAIPDAETRHRKRLARIMSDYPGLAAYVQDDPHGSPIYICQKDDARSDRYTRGCPVIV